MCLNGIVRVALAAFIVGSVIVGTRQADAQEQLRIWTDSTRKFKVTARIVGFDGTTVRLEKQDKSPASLPIAKLSGPDQEYVRRYDSRNPFRAKGPAPAAAQGFQPATAEALTSEAPASAPPKSPTEGVVAPSPVWDDVPGLGLFAESKPPSATPLPTVGVATPQTISLPFETVAEDVDDIYVDERSSTAFLRLLTKVIDKRKVVRVVRVDLAGGAASAPVILPQGCTTVGWEGGGNRFVVRELADAMTTERTIRVWRLRDGGYEQLLFIPAFGSSGETTMQADFLEGERLATISDRGRVAIWSLETGEVLASKLLLPQARMQASADGRLLAVSNGENVHFLDAATLTQVGGIAGAGTEIAAMAFSADGRRFAVSAKGGGVWDLADGNKIVTLDGGAGADKRFFFADADTLFDSETMTDVESGVPIFQVKGGLVHAIGEGDRAWYLFDDDRKKVRALAPEIPRPNDAAEKISDSEATPRGWLLPPNQPIRVDVKLLPRDQDVASVKAHLESSVAKAGHEVAADASLMLTATALPAEKPVALAYIEVTQAPRMSVDDYFEKRFGGGLPKVEPRAGGPPLIDGQDPFGDPFGGDPFGPLGPFGPTAPPQVKRTVFVFQPIEMTLELELLGETLWSKTSSPLKQDRGLIRLPKGTTIEAHMRKLVTADIEKFLAMNVPRSIPRNAEVEARPACGFFKVTENGLAKAK